MSRNIDRRPVYPTEEERRKQQAEPAWKRLWHRAKGFYYWLCFIFLALFLIALVPQMIYMQKQRLRAERNPVKASATITGIDKGYRYVGPTVHIEYTVDDSVYRNGIHPVRKIVKQLQVGQSIHIIYEAGNPSNSRLDKEMYIY